MARKRKTNPELRAEDIQLRQPDRSGPAGKTLVDLAQERSLFSQADEAQARLAPRPTTTDAQDDPADPPVLPPGAERFLEAMLWTVSLAMLHFTFDVLVQHQYGRELAWPDIIARTSKSWLLLLLLFWPLHPHYANGGRLLPARLVPSARVDHTLRQVLFAVAGTAAGCHLVYVTNSYGHLAVMKRAPPLGCLWVWAVIELELPWALGSLALTGGYLWLGGYSIY